MLLWVATAFGMAAAGAAGQPLAVLDAFGRDVTGRGVLLLDWDGHLANPAIKLTAAFEPSDRPRTLDIRSDCLRLIFDRAGDLSIGPLGKSMRIEPGQTQAEFWVSVFPDRDGKDEAHAFELRMRGDARWTPVPVRVLDQDRPRKPAFPILLDFGHDRTGFLKDPAVRRVVRQAADDWARFIADMRLDPVPKGDESTDLWTPEGFVRSYAVRNARPYRGFLLYVTGVKGPELRSGGAPSRSGKRQSSRGNRLPLMRSGAVEVEVQGSYTKYGWRVGDSDEGWWISGSQAGEPADLYSIVLHEIGHALAFEAAYPRFGEALRTGRLDDPGLTAYLGFAPAVDRFGHFDRCLDPASGFGAFGAEYQAKMKVRRWLLTKTHLLMLKAAGYELAPASCFEELALAAPSVTLELGREAGGLRLLRGGVPAYQCAAEGRLPKGLVLDAFDGSLHGAPQEEGRFEVRIEACDQSPVPNRIVEKLQITVVPTKARRAGCD